MLKAYISTLRELVEKARAINENVWMQMPKGERHYCGAIDADLESVLDRIDKVETVALEASLFE